MIPQIPFMLSDRRPWHDAQVIAAPALSPAKIKKKEAWASDEKLSSPALS